MYRVKASTHRCIATGILVVGIVLCHFILLLESEAPFLVPFPAKSSRCYEILLAMSLAKHSSSTQSSCAKQVVVCYIWIKLLQGNIQIIVTTNTTT